MDAEFGIELRRVYQSLKLGLGKKRKENMWIERIEKQEEGWL